MITTVIDRANELCMAARKARQLRALAIRATNYMVFSGDTFSQMSEFEFFSDALALHRIQLLRGTQSKLVSACYEPADGDGSRECTGLSADESEQVELLDLETELSK